MKKPILLLTAVTAGLSLAQMPLQAQAAPCFSVIQIGPESLYQSDCPGERQNTCPSAPQIDVNDLLEQLGLSDCRNVGSFGAECYGNLFSQNSCGDTDCADADCDDTDCDDRNCERNDCNNGDCNTDYSNFLNCLPGVQIQSNCTPQISFWRPQAPATQKPTSETNEAPTAQTPAEETPAVETPAEETPSITDTDEASSHQTPATGMPSNGKPSGEVTNPVITQPEAPEPAAPAQEVSKPAENPAPVEEPSKPEVPATPDKEDQTTAEQPSNPEVPATPGKEDQTTAETPSTVAPSDTPVQETQQNTAGYHAYVLRIVELVNEARAQAGLQPVSLRQDLTAVAQLRAKETVTLFSHTRPNGSSCFTALGEYGVSYRGAGENIAYGQRSPEEVMEGWMNSSGHRANILNARFTSIGVGYYQGANGVKYWSQMFTY